MWRRRTDSLLRVAALSAVCIFLVISNAAGESVSQESPKFEPIDDTLLGHINANMKLSLSDPEAQDGIDMSKTLQKRLETLKSTELADLVVYLVRKAMALPEDKFQNVLQNSFFLDMMRTALNASDASDLNRHCTASLGQLIDRAAKTTALADAVDMLEWNTRNLENIVISQSSFNALAERKLKGLTIVTDLQFEKSLKMTQNPANLNEKKDWL